MTRTLALLAALIGTTAPVEPLPTALVTITDEYDEHVLTVEIAAKDVHRERGLMGRDRLPAGSGMLFVYGHPRPPDAGFWMHETTVPLDIAFISTTGHILAIRSMDPCPDADSSDCPVYTPGAWYQYALEVNRGYFAANGIGPGARVRVEGALPPVLP